MGRRSGEKQKQPCRPGATKPLYHPDSPPEYKKPNGLMRPRNAGLAARTVGPCRLRNHIPPPLPAGFHLLRLSYRVVCTAYSLFHCRYYFCIYNYNAPFGCCQPEIYAGYLPKRRLCLVILQKHGLQYLSNRIITTQISFKFLFYLCFRSF